MATFDAAQITDLAEILGTNSDVLDDHLDYYASLITESDKTKVLARVVEWQAIDGNFAWFSPTESNEGFNLSPGQQRTKLASWIAQLLQWPYVSSGQSSLIRG